MPKYSINSTKNLSTTHEDLQILFNTIIKYVDCTIVRGHATPEEQFELWKQGRTKKNGFWEIENKGKIITNCDGFNIKSEHNYFPSIAVDAVPYPELYSDNNKSVLFSGFVLGVATMLYEKGIIKHKIRSGIDWDGDFNLKNQTLFDPLHFFIVQ